MLRWWFWLKSHFIRVEIREVYREYSFEELIKKMAECCWCEGNELKSVISPLTEGPHIKTDFGRVRLRTGKKIKITVEVK